MPPHFSVQQLLPTASALTVLVRQIAKAYKVQFATCGTREFTPFRGRRDGDDAVVGPTKKAPPFAAFGISLKATAASSSSSSTGRTINFT